MYRARLYGGPHDGRWVTLVSEPPTIMIGHVEYERVDDPETGEPLGAYVATTRDFRL